MCDERKGGDSLDVPTSRDDRSYVLRKSQLVRPSGSTHEGDACLDKDTC